MSQKLHLFQLIKSLSVSEKGYFKKYYAKYGGNQTYLILFDAIDAMDEYDEDAIKENFSDQGFTNQFSVAKNYLIKNLLKSLRAYHSESSNHMKLNEMMLDIEILYKRRLVDMCKKLAKKARKTMEDAELFNKYSELASWEIRIANLEPYTKEKEEIVREVYDFALEGIEKDKNLIAYRHLAYHLFNMSLKSGATRQEENINLAQSFLDNPLLAGPEMALSITAKGIYYNIMSKIYEMQYDYENCYHVSKNFVDIVHDNPNIFENNITNYVLPAHYNLLLTCVYLNKKEPFLENLDRLANIPERYAVSQKEILEKLVHLLCANVELQYYVQNGLFQEACKVIPKAEEIIDDDHSIGFPSVRVELCYNIAYAYFGLGEYSTAIDWLNKITQKEQVELREDLLVYAWLLNLTSHFELKNFRYLGYKLKATYNFISKLEKIHGFEQTTLDFIKQLIKCKDDAEIKETMSGFREKFAALEMMPYERIALKSFDIISWLDSHLLDRKFSDISFEKYHQD